MDNPKIIFIGTSEFAVPILEGLISSNYQIPAVITTLDKPIPSPVKQIASRRNLSILQPDKISDIGLKIVEAKPDLIITAAYGQIIPEDILTIPEFKSLNLHPSLLPKYRGPSPIQNAILNNDKTTGVTLMLMDQKMDHGPIVAQEQITITPDDDYSTLEKKLAHQAAELLIKTLPLYFQGKIKPQAQDESKASYTKTLTRQDGQIDWSQKAQVIERKIRAFYPWPGAWTEFNNQRVKVLKAKVIKEKQPASLATGQNYLLLELVQPAGKKPMSGQDFFRGHRAII
jgi:methionyl-tRNA formyltransferase|tara:strand:- start:2429 stop:3286 length:858 start_codon:yes stop_codon:yes gene_type:complete